MSIIGTRPPLISETNFYELHHRARLAIKPGITGMWQVSGRSDITDFEEVVRLDKEYITNWNIGLDIKILLKGIFSCWFTSACIMTFIDFHKKNKRKIIYGNLLFIIAAAFITQSRAWVLQTLILLFVFVAVLGNRNRYVKFLMGLLLIFIVILGVSYVFPEITGNLFNRGVEDTRSGQYVIFFAQHSWKDLIFGLGINASYSYLGNINYTYFDNQFMFAKCVMVE